MLQEASDNLGDIHWNMNASDHAAFTSCRLCRRDRCFGDHSVRFSYLDAKFSPSTLPQPAVSELTSTIAPPREHHFVTIKRWSGFCP
jgi:hypothetical protein